LLMICLGISHHRKLDFLVSVDRSFFNPATNSFGVR
jgi:hypothetical protein